MKDVQRSFLPLRGAVGGFLMGLANLVPGISGGTMLLATGVYPEFIAAIAELTIFRFRPRSMVMLASIGGAAAVAILLFAGLTKGLVVDHRYIMYSLFIGLTLGGVPIVWRLARPLTAGVASGAVAGLIVMVLLSVGEPGATGSAHSSSVMLFLAGLAGASAMILPGVSGGYLLLLLGQYIPILSAIDDFKTGLLESPIDLPMVIESLKVGIPVGLGVLGGIVGVSNLLKFLWARHEKPTLGVLLGLLIGAVFGLWPFQRPIPPPPGSVIKGIVVTADNMQSIDREDWPTERFEPDAVQAATSAGFVLAGIALTHLVGRLGGHEA
ncbi:MAG TPA: DUF368 domain-containing protein [Vicinamibacteria bacterium]|nr:DUF368 domain-containing protein [Vicinamibacteria bacterium]